MNPTHEPLKVQLWDNLITLTEACPVAHCSSDDCLVHRLREKEPARQMAWFRALSHDDLVYLAAYHHICLHTKMRPFRRE